MGRTISCLEDERLLAGPDENTIIHQYGDGATGVGMRSRSSLLHPLRIEQPGILRLHFIRRQVRNIAKHVQQIPGRGVIEI